MINITKQAVDPEFYYTSDFSGEEISDYEKQGLFRLNLEVLGSDILNLQSLPFNLHLTKDEFVNLIHSLKLKFSDAFKQDWNDKIDHNIDSGRNFIENNPDQEEEHKEKVLKALDFFEKLKV